VPGVPPGVEPDPAALDQLAELIAGSPHNLVGARDRAVVRARHVDEALALAPLLAPVDGARWMDLGTGGGLPGLVLAMAFPSVQWVLLDATRKKLSEVRRFADALGLGNVETAWGRAEELARVPEHRGRYDGVVCRALGQLVVVMELARGFLRDGGELAAVKGPAVAEELPRARKARKGLAFGVIHSKSIADPGRATLLVTMRAQGPPPIRIPRRVGQPAATPLGG
jgi:16S rRNA (guanine527-N7)-methyltransferase